MAAKTKNTALTTSVMEKPRMEKYREWLVLAAFAVAVGSLSLWTANVWVESGTIRERLQSGERLKLRASHKADVLATWLKGKARLGESLVDSGLLRLSLSEMAAGEAADASIMASLKAQKPYLERALSELASHHRAAGAWMVKADGEIWLSTAAAHPGGDVMTRVQSLLEKEKAPQAVFGPMRQVKGVGETNVFVDLLRPVPRIGGDELPPAGVMIVRLPADDILTALNAPGLLAEPGERSLLIQNAGFAWQRVGPEGLQPVLTETTPIEGGHTARAHLGAGFSESHSLLDGAPVFAYTLPLAGTDWLIRSERTMLQALARADQRRHIAYTLAVLVTSVLTAVFCALIWYHRGAQAKKLAENRRQVIDALVRAVEIRDPYLAGHYDRMAYVARRLASHLHLGTDERETMFLACQLAGVGKVFVPQEILTKPGKLTKKELTLLRRHVDHAMNVLGGIDFDYPVVPVIRHLHERMDGSGYPRGLKGRRINKLARILAICDAYCALTSPRAWRKGMPPAEAIAVMENETGKYDPEVLEALEDLMIGADFK